MTLSFRKALFLPVLLLCLTPLTASDSILLKYTYRPDQAPVGVLKDAKSKTYLPLADVAKFYGIELKFDAQDRRITLSKGKNVVKMVLDQPMFLTTDPIESIPTEPAELVDGQLAVTPTTAQDLLLGILGINTEFVADQQALVVGGIKTEELKKEIVQQAAIVTPPTPEPDEEVMGTRGEEPAQAPVVMHTRPLSSQEYAVRRIVIDAGHGGRDIGAKGFDNRYFEKQATLAIALKVVKLLQRQPGLEVLMTRNKDYYVTLKGRTQYANKHRADLFVSIHCNSTPRSKMNIASGTEIYVYSPKASSYFGSVEDSEELVTGSNIGFKDDLRSRAYKERSIWLAKFVWQYIHKNLGQHMRRVQPKNFYVLARVDMPSILIETAFISNPKEEFKLRDEEWQEKMAQSIADGIVEYRQVVNGDAYAQAQ